MYMYYISQNNYVNQNDKIMFFYVQGIWGYRIFWEQV